MDSYRILSAYYDRFTDDVPYAQWADYMQAIFQKEAIAPKLILDLACGTGSLIAELAGRGYEMIGIDASAEMLSQAMQNTVQIEPRPLYLNQRMEDLDLFGTVDACLCCLDSINYVVHPEMLQEVFRRVEMFLNPGGLFLFDVNTLEKIKRIAGQSFVREDDDVYCVWQCLLEGTLCTYEFDIFEKTIKNYWIRYQETHQERIYTIQTLREMLEQAGFVDIKVYPELSFGSVCGTEDRLFFTARKREHAGSHS